MIHIQLYTKHLNLSKIWGLFLLKVKNIYWKIKNKLYNQYQNTEEFVWIAKLLLSH